MQVSSGTFNDIFSFFTRDYKPFKSVLSGVLSEIPQLENFLIDVEQRGQSLKAEIKSFFESYTQSKNNQLCPLFLEYLSLSKSHYFQIYEYHHIKSDPHHLVNL